MNSRITVLSIVFICVLLSTNPLLSQELTGGITGSVVDEQGGVVPGAEVAATHVSTNTVYNAVTGDAGRFQIPQARLGVYRIVVQLTGFNSAVVEGVTVETGGIADVNVSLSVGDIQQEVIVEGAFAQEIVNTVDAEISAMVDKQQVMDLPLNGRNASQLALLQAGTFYERTSTGEGDKLIIHGQRHRSINITLDGVDTQDNLLRASSVMLNQPLMELSAEHVQEFRVVTGISNAEYTRGGVHISAVTKGGGNDWHGALFLFHRNTVFNANTFFNNRDGIERNQLIRNQFGGSMSGPIWKDRTFFYFGFEEFREARGIPVNRTVWTQEARDGIFRYLDGLRNTPEAVAANPDLIRTVNLFACGGGESSILRRDCVARGPGGDFWNLSNQPSYDPLVSGQLFRVMPLPNNSDIGDGLNLAGFRFNSSVKTYVHKPSFRLDHNFTDTQTLYFSFNYNDRNINGDYINEREPRYPDLEPLGERNTLTRSYAAAWASTWSPTLISELRAGLIWGENNFPRNQPFNTPYTLDFDDITDPYDPGGSDTARVNKTFSLRESLTWTRGNHQVRGGVEYRYRYVNNRSLFGIVPEMDFNDTDNPPGFSSSNLRAIATAPGCVPTPDGRCASSTPNSTDFNNAEELFNNLTGSLGDVEQTYNATSPTSGFVPGAYERRIWEDQEFDWFIQDTWNFSPRLTFNFGLRWEYQSVPDELQGMSLMPEGGFDSVFGISGREGFFNPGVLAGSACSMLDSPLTPSTDNVESLILSCATKNEFGGAFHGKPFYKEDKNNFAPVLGLAWDPQGNGKTSIRAGFRISYIQDHFGIIDGNVDDNEGLSVAETCNPAEEDSQIPCSNSIFLARDVTADYAPNPQVPPFEVPATRSFLNSTAQDFRTFEPNLGTPYYNEWTLSIQREIFPEWALEARYVGNRGVKMRRIADYNEINTDAYDPVSGMTFLDSFLLAQNNLACNRANGRDSSGFADNTGFECIIPNPLMADLIAGDASSLDSRGDLLDALDFNETGDFIWHLLIDETSRPSSGESRIRGGSFFGQVLQGRFPANFFMANPFVASSRSFVGDGSSTYHGLQIEMRRRFSAGLAFQANYTYGKAISDYDGDENSYLNDTRPSSYRYKNYTRGEFMPRHTFNANWLYELPFGPGRRYMASDNFWGHVLGGWNFGGLLNWRSGQPFRILSGRGTFHRNAISDENGVNVSNSMDRAGIGDLMGRQDISGGVFWIDPCTSSQVGGACQDSRATAEMFQLPDPGKLGELGAASFFGPSAFSLDFNLRKITKITETTSLEFRWEVFNAFNNVVFTQPVNNIFNASFGQILNTRRDPRLMQFALRLYF